MKKKTKVIVSSALSMAVCASLIAGSTLAIFSSESKTDVAITSGKVNVEASVDEESLKSYWASWDEASSGYKYAEYTDGKSEKKFSQGGTYEYSDGQLKLTNIAPGEGISFNLKITNKSTISVKYQVRLTAVNNAKEGEEAKNLADKLRADFQFDNKDTETSFKMDEISKDDKGGTQVSSTFTFASDWSEDAIAAPTGEEEQEITTVPVGIWLPTTADNDVQEASCTLTVGVYAVQANAHVTNPPTDGTLAIYNGADLRAFSKNTAAMGLNAELMSDIYLDDSDDFRSFAYVLADVGSLAEEEDFEPIGTTGNPYTGTFNGNGYTIYGLKASGANAGLFGVTQDATIENLKIARADITASEKGSKAGILVGTAKGTLDVSNVKVEDSTVKAAESAKNATVGALVGAADEGATVTVQNIEVQMNESDSELGGSVLVGSGDIDYKGENEARFELEVGFVEVVKYQEDGTSQKWYEVSTADGLKYFATSVNEGTTYEKLTVKLVKDIDLKNEEWTPIGNETTQFKGIFDGAKSETEVYTISNLKIDQPEKNFVGLFNYIATKGSEIRNFELHNVDVKGQTNVGAVAGGNETKYGGDGDPRELISNVIVSGNIKIEGNTRVGGITGGANTKVKDCKVIGSAGSYIKGVYNTEKMAQNSDANLEGDNVGGIVGFTCESGTRYADFVSGCYVSGVTISGTRKVGGVVAYLSGEQGVQNSTFENGTVECNASDEYIKGNESKLFVGGIVGEISGGNNTIKGNTVKDATVSLVELHTYDNIDPEILGGCRNAMNNLTYSENTVENTTLLVYGVAVGEDGSAEIHTVEQFRSFAENYEKFAGGYVKHKVVKLEADLDLGEWTPIGDVKNGIVYMDFDGQGHTITYHINKSISDAGSVSLGLFACLGKTSSSYDSCVKNLIVKGDIVVSGELKKETSSIFTPSLNIGGITGNAGSKCSITNCVSSVNIDVSNVTFESGYFANIGGISGGKLNSITDVVYTGTIKLWDGWNDNASPITTRVGGICSTVGDGATLTNALNVGTVPFKCEPYDGASTSSGGVVGAVSFEPTIENIFSVGVDSNGDYNQHTNDAIEELTEENWATKCEGLQQAGWTWSETFNCPVPALNA